jgi:hypothetical protein
MHHDAIELKEAEREAAYQGISVEEALSQHEPVPSQDPPAEQAEKTDQEVPKKFERQIPPEQQDPAVRFRQAKADSEAHGDWGLGEAGYKSPKTPSERMRKNLPYKVTVLFAELLSEVDIEPYAVQVPPELGRFLAYPRYFVAIFTCSMAFWSNVSLASFNEKCFLE